MNSYGRGRRRGSRRRDRGRGGALLRRERKIAGGAGKARPGLRVPRPPPGAGLGLGNVVAQGAYTKHAPTVGEHTVVIGCARAGMKYLCAGRLGGVELGLRLCPVGMDGTEPVQRVLRRGQRQPRGVAGAGGLVDLLAVPFRRAMGRRRGVQPGGAGGCHDQDAF